MYLRTFILKKWEVLRNIFCVHCIILNYNIAAKSWLIGKDSDAGRDWGQEEKGTTEDEMAGWHHWLDGHESEWTRGVGDGQGGLVYCNSWGRKESDTTEQLNWPELKYELRFLSKNSIKQPITVSLQNSRRLPQRTQPISLKSCFPHGCVVIPVGSQLTVVQVRYSSSTFILWLFHFELILLHL